MFLYRCQSCGEPSYSSANASTVGACPHCDAPLAGQPEADAMASTQGRRLRLAGTRPDAGARESVPRR